MVYRANMLAMDNGGVSKKTLTTSAGLKKTSIAPKQPLPAVTSKGTPGLGSVNSGVSGGTSYNSVPVTAPSVNQGAVVNDWVAQMKNELNTTKAEGPDFKTVNDHLASLKKELNAGPNAPKLPAEINLDNFKTEMATIEDISRKFGFDYSKEYAEQQAAAMAQAQRDEITAARERAAYETDSAKVDLEHDFFNQYLQQQQQMANTGINAGIASDRNIRLDMSRQNALADILANAQLFNQELDRRSETITKEELAYAEQLYNERLQQGFGNAMDVSRFEQSENQFQSQQALQQRQQLVDEAWREFEFNNMSESEKQKLLQSAKQHGEEMAWREYEFNNMSAAEKAKLVADAERFGMEMAWERHKFDAGLQFQAGAGSFNSSGGGGGNPQGKAVNFTQFKQTSSFGTRKDPITGKTASHGGNDYAMPVGTPVQANVSGKVIKQGVDKGGFGNYMAIQDSQGNVHIYAHLSKHGPKVGTMVTAGQVVGSSGNTGRSTGPHLHYEVRQGSMGGAKLNPNNFLK